ncbi:hypothetical protein ACN38_g3150 [Penicillium nordicum]|uniref:Uncharacterized protein n=1 Tax=Penicillium nordicum TaxID=229535 RepID=A0A0M8PDG9_9EURO|nr:hypothetical protein ACN38_g3150 [Penicillium nordicum]
MEFTRRLFCLPAMPARISYPAPVLHKYFDGRAPAPTTAFVMPVFDIPPLVSDEPTNHQFRDLYPLGRTRDFPSRLRCLRVKSKKKMENTCDMVQEKLRGIFDFEKDDLWFRGMNLRSLMLLMSFFVPVISTSNSDNEFGPGIYATNDFDEGAKYAHPQGDLQESRLQRPFGVEAGQRRMEQSDGDLA